MADERVYEQRLIDAIISWQREQQKASKFIKASQDQLSLMASIKGRIAGLIGVSASDAASYINYTTGKFKGGKYMPHCLDSQLKQMFAQLEDVTKEVHKYPYHTGTEAKAAVDAKLNIMGQHVNEIKRVYGEAKYKEIATRAKANAIKITGISF